MKRLVILFSVLLALSTALFSLSLVPFASASTTSTVQQERTATTDFSGLEVGTTIKSTNVTLNTKQSDLLGGFTTIQKYGTATARVVEVVELDGVNCLKITNSATSGYTHVNMWLGEDLVPGYEYTVSITYKFTEGYVKPESPGTYGYLLIRNNNGFGDIHVLDKTTGENQVEADADGWYTYTTTVTTKTAGGTNLNKILLLVTSNKNTEGEATGIYLKSLSITGLEDVPLEEEIETNLTATTDFSGLEVGSKLSTDATALKVTRYDLQGGFAKTSQQFSTGSLGKTTVVEDTDGSKNLLITTTSTTNKAYVHVNFFLGKSILLGKEYTISITYKLTDNYVAPTNHAYGSSIVIRNSDLFGNIKVCDENNAPQGTVDANGWYTYTTTFTTSTTATSNLNKFILLVSANGTAEGEATGIYLKSITLTGPGIAIQDNSVASTVRINYWNPDDLNNNPTSIVLYRGVHTDTDNTYRDKITDYTTGEENGIPYIEANLKRGVYYATTAYGSDIITKYIWVEGLGEPMVVDIKHKPMTSNNWSEATVRESTDELLEAFASTDNLVGYEPFDTPTFTLHEDYSKEFMTNAEACDYVDNLDANSSNLYVYYPFNLSAMGNKTPILVFTKTDLTGKTFEEAGTIIRGLRKEVFMITGGLHGNEPAGMEGNLALAKELCGTYGDSVLDYYGAIVIMPIVSVDNHQRWARSTKSGINPNRELMKATIESTQNQIATYNNFMPTVYVDCHEDYGRFYIDEATGIISEELMDVAIRYTSVQNSPLYTVQEGQYDVVNDKGYIAMVNAIDDTKALGLRSEVYYVGTTNPCNSKDYPITRGSYSFIIEVMRISTGKSRYARAIFAMKEALKSIIDTVYDYDGEIANDVYTNRDRVAGITEYDENRLFALAFKTSGNNKVTFPYPTLKPDGSYANADRTYSRSLVDTVTKVRSMPTAYVVDATNPNIDEILRILNVHNIKYTKINAGSTLLLKQYSGGYKNTVIGDATDVMFENGAYVVTLNCSDAHFIPYLFEPDSIANGGGDDSTISFAHMGLITDENPVYRSEVSGIAQIVETLGKPLTISYEVKGEIVETSSTNVLIDAPNYGISGYQFVGWYNEELGLYKAGATLINPSGDITFEAIFVKLEMVEGAGIRLVANKPSGLEFYTKYDITNTDVAGLITFHTLIAPTDKITSEFTVENYPNGITGLVTNCKNIYYNQNEDYSYYQGSIVNILTYNYARSFSGLGFIAVNYANGETENLYANYNEENNSRSIYEVALKAYKDRQVTQDDIYANNTGDGYYSRFNNEELKAIKSYIDGVVNITFENGNLSVANPYVDVASGYKTYEAPYTVSIEGKIITISPKAGSDWTFYQGVTGKTEYYRVSIIINGIRQIPTNTEQFIVSDSTSNTKDVIGTITVKVILGPGDAEDIFPEEGFFAEDDDPTIDPPVDDYSTFSKDLVFVGNSLKGTADGSTPNNATTLNNALGYVKKNDGVIVVTEPINLDEYIDGKYFFPANDKVTTITSVYGGVDYRKTSNASITVSSVVSMYGDYVFEKVDFISGSSTANLCFQYNNVTIGEGVNCTRATDVTNDIALTAGYAVAAGFVMPMYEVSCHEDAKIIIKSGTWQYIRGGNHRNNANAPFGTIDENATLVIKVEGGTFTATATKLVSAVGMNSVDGTVYMEITGGIFAGDVNLYSRFGSNNTQSYTTHNTGSATLNIKGGTFNGTAIKVYQSDAFTTNTGTNLICIQGGTFASGLTVTGSSTANDTLILGDGITLTNTYFNTIKNGATETAKIVEPTLGYNAPVYTTPPASMNPELGTNFVAKNENGDFIVSDTDIDAAIDEIWDTYQNYIEMDLEEGEDLETKFKADLKSRITKIRNLAGLDGVNDALNEFRTLKDTNNEYNLNRVVSSKFITLLTGEYSINKTVTNYGIGGAGGGYMIDCGDFVLVAFGDTEDENGLGSPWRANTLGYTTDFDYTDGIKFDGFYLNDAGEWNGDATEFLNSSHANNTEMSKIPTGGIKIGNTLYFGYMSVRTWANDENNQGSGSSWQCNYGGLAISRDMGRTWETPADLRWPELSYYAQLYPVLDGDMVYIFGVPGGRNGACKLMRVHKDYIENFAAYEYLVGRDANGNPIYERGYDAMMSDYAIVEKAVGGVGVVWNEYLGEWIMMYASSNTGDITRASIVMRVAKSLDGVWSDPVVVMSQSTYGAVYEPRICQKYSQGNKLMVICSRWDIYNSLIFEVELEKKN